MQLFPAGILNVGPVLMVGMKQHFVQAAPINISAHFCAYRKVLLFFGRRAFRIRRVSQFPTCLVEPNGAFDVSAGIQNTNLTGAKARAALCVVDCLFLVKNTG